MKVRLLAFGIAKDILGSRTMEFDLHTGDRIEDLHRALLMEYPGFAALAALSFAVNEEYATKTMILREGDEIVLLPPVSGG
jgi:molybdopterin synthase sulfur carrier subunit